MIQIFVDIFITIVNSVIHVFFWITIVFVAIERFAGTKVSESWKPEDLYMTAIPVKKQIAKSEVFFSLLWTVLWVAVLLNSGWYRNNNGSEVFYSLFNKEELMIYMPAIVGVVVVEIGLAIYKLVKAQWTKMLVVLNGVYHIFVAILLCLMVSNPNLFNQQFIEVFLDMGVDSSNWLTIIWGTVGLTIIYSLYDIVKSIQAWRSPMIESAPSNDFMKK
jgi:hypothetical protein